MNPWLLFALLALGTFGLRFSFIYLSGKIEMPTALQNALQYIPAAALAALVFPALLAPNGNVDFSPQNLRLLAGLGGALAAWKTKNVLWTLITGMVLLWGLKWLLG